MEGLSDILVLLLVVVASLVGSITKKTKKKQLTLPQDTPWNDLSQETSNSATPKESQVIPPIPKPIAEQVQSSSKSVSVNVKREKTTPGETTESDDIRKIIDQFDLRTAVIYTEILKPKFKEY